MKEFINNALIIEIPWAHLELFFLIYSSSNRSADKSSSVVSGFLSSCRNLLVQAVAIKDRRCSAAVLHSSGLCRGVCVWTNRSLPHLPPFPSFSLPLVFLRPRWCRSWTWVMMLSSLLVSIYQRQTGGRSVARVRVRAGTAVTDEENGCGQQRMRRVLVRVWMLGWDELQWRGPGPASVRAWFIDSITARQD